MARERRIYLNMKSRTDARNILLDRFATGPVLSTEEIPTVETAGRVLARPVFALLSSPNFHTAAMDGIALRARDTFGTNEANPRRLVVDREASYVNTGQMLPEGTDAVVMIEHVHVPDEKTVQIESAAYPWQHVRKMGEDMVATELLFPQNHRITPSCIGALLTGGIYAVPVKARPRMLIVPTGSELVEWQETLPEDVKPGQVVETNSYVLGGLCAARGGAWERHRRLPDDYGLRRGQGGRRGV
ncbi:hypothetical protein ACFL0Q_04160 [Thermodesulfobacteriota bacterium]